MRHVVEQLLLLFCECLKFCLTLQSDSCLIFFVVHEPLATRRNAFGRPSRIFYAVYQTCIEGFDYVESVPERPERRCTYLTPHTIEVDQLEY